MFGIRVRRNWSAALLCLLLRCILATLSGVCAAQVESGKIVGTVKDASGAIISGAAVTVTETETNAERKAPTNSEGEYVVTELKPGTYNVTAECEGFKTAV